MSDEMKKWMPYKSIVEQDGYLDKKLYDKNKIDKPVLLDDEIQKINLILQNYKGEELEIKYYFDGYIYITKSKLFRIDIDQKRIYLDRTKYISFKDILDLNSPISI